APAAGVAVRDAGADRLAQLRATLEPRDGGVLGLMGYGAIPSASASTLQVNRNTVGPEGGDPTLTLSQFGFGFEVDETFPLWLEIYASYTRYDPRAVLQGEATRDVSVRWNNFTTTVGIGWDFYLADSLYVTPILNLAGGYAASDTSLATTFLARRRDRSDPTALSEVQANVWGLGGALMLTYFNYSAARQIDVQARYTQLRLQTFGNSLPASRGTSTSSTLSVWSQYRWPTGIEVFRRPLRWVVTGAASYYFGDQRQATGFAWSTTIGGGIEFDVGRLQFGAMGLEVSRVQFTLNYLYADRNITGASFGLGISF
ncbi:hypothetical protein, partial [Roseomonas rosulenta]|uniref:hypothetical protein n=1 Tax=Roseomonas rosulenta TaxID=2748667 RepID=UPI0018E0264A